MLAVADDLAQRSASQPTISDINSLKYFPFLDSTLIAELKAELANYTAAAVECQLS